MKSFKSLLSLVLAFTVLFSNMGGMVYADTAVDDTTVGVEQEDGSTLTELNEIRYVVKNVSVREEPNTESNKLGGYVVDEKVNVTGITADGVWYKVAFGDTVGFVKAYCLSDVEPQFTVTNMYKETMYVSKSAKFRSEPNTSAGILRSLQKQEVVKVVAKVDGKSWYRITVGGQTGYVKKNCLTTVKPEFTIKAMDKSLYCTKPAKLRTGPNKSYEKVRDILVKEEVKVFAKVNGCNWYKVKVGSKTGYVHGGYVSSKKPKYVISAYNKTMYCTKNASVRKGPNSEYGKLTKVTSNEKIKVIAKVVNKNWYQVKYEGKTGYVYKKNLSTKKPKFLVSKRSESKYITFKSVLRKGPSKGYKKVTTVPTNAKVKVTGKVIGKNWYRVEYKGKTGYVLKGVLSKDRVSYSVIGSYEDSTSKITVYKEWYKYAWVYAAHIEYKEYDRLKTAKAYGGGYETTSSAAARLGAVLAVNGDYNADSKGGVVRNKVVYKDKGYCDAGGVYNQKTGIFECGYDLSGSLTSLVKKGRITDTMSFGYQANYIKDGELCPNIWGKSRAQRTFMGTNGNAGDIWLCVSDGRYNDGVSPGLTYHECGKYLLTKGCTFAVPLDGGGSSTMVFKGNTLNAARGNERAVVDYVYFKY